MELEKIVGQVRIKKTLQRLLKLPDVLPHILFFGGSGLGKTSFAKAVANERGSPLLRANGATIRSEVEIFRYLMKIQDEHTIFFIDEVHRLSIKLQEVLYTAMENFVIDFEQEGFENDEITHDIPKFTLIAATTEFGLLSQAFRDRCPIQLYIEPYTFDDISKILELYDDSTVKIDYRYLASFSRGIPRKAKQHLDWVVIYCRSEHLDNADKDIIKTAMKEQGIYNLGLTGADLEYMAYLDRQTKCIGVRNIANSISSDQRSIEGIIEPWLKKCKFIVQNHKGRLLNKQKYIQYLKEIQLQ